MYHDRRPNKVFNEENDDVKKLSLDITNEGEDEKQNQQPQIDFVLFLQQTGSIIALAEFMDALE